MLGFNDITTLVGHFMSSPTKMEKRDRRGDEKERQGRKRKMNESVEEIKTSPPLYPYLLQGKQALPNCKPVSVGRPGDTRYTTSLPLPTIPRPTKMYSQIRNFAILF